MWFEDALQPTGIAGAELKQHLEMALRGLVPSPQAGRSGDAEARRVVGHAARAGAPRPGGVQYPADLPTTVVAMMQRLAGNSAVGALLPIVQRDVRHDAAPPAASLDPRSLDNWLQGRPGQSYYGVMHLGTGVIYLGPGEPIIEPERIEGFAYTPSPKRSVQVTGSSGQGGHGGLVFAALGGPKAIRDCCGFGVTKRKDGAFEATFRSGLNACFDWTGHPYRAQVLGGDSAHRIMPPLWATHIQSFLESVLVR